MIKIMIMSLMAVGGLVNAGEAIKDYPLNTCVVSGETLGSMGKPYLFQHEGRDVYFCCKGCRKDFLKDPAAYLKKIDDAEKAAAK